MPKFQSLIDLLKLKGGQQNPSHREFGTEADDLYGPLTVSGAMTPPAARTSGLREPTLEDYIQKQARNPTRD